MLLKMHNYNNEKTHPKKNLNVYKVPNSALGARTYRIRQKKKDKTEIAAGLGRRTRGDTEKWDQNGSPEISDRG